MDFGEIHRGSKKFKRNIRILSADLTYVPFVISTKFLTNMTVLGFIANKGNVIPLHSFPKGLRVNIDEYLDVLKAVVKLCMDQISENCHNIWQHGGAPAQNSKKGSARTSRSCERRRSSTHALQNLIFWTILCRAFLSLVKTQPLTKNGQLDEEDKGVDGVLRQGHRGEGLPKGGVTGRPETTCPRTNVLGPLVPKLFVPCNTISLD